jgi:hypothetical protein
VVLLLLPFSLAMDDGEFSNSGIGSGGGSLVAVVVVVAMDNNKTMTKAGGRH